jgi:hypothetical protein
MEPVVFPKLVSPLTRADRVKRAKPREDQSGGSFAKHLHQNAKEQAEDGTAAEDEREQAAAEAPGTAGVGADEAGKKAIDIHV